MVSAHQPSLPGAQPEDPFPLPGAAYIRFSSEMQSDWFSLDAQTAHIQTFVQSQGLNLIQLYTGAGVSAKKCSHRPVFEQILPYANKGSFDSRG